MEIYVIDSMKNHATVSSDIAPTLTENMEETKYVPIIYDARGNGGGTVCPTITGDHENRITDYTAVVIQTVPIEGNGSRPSHRGNGYGDVNDPMFTLNSTEAHAVAYEKKQ